ncbi:uncharacterized protein K452DRAFT_305259 [Aplosporella prunicola CBS 121167]|uniref:DUF4219 domain-containing protein n=1 Tax=Aplosporella prunicola CBS 121167 TaxID=1176127 RepID=A0A6A6BQA7_9PEZI|nr:uncharacterized protein K452DRAFT_305259 [Aplosporella prunicola CBS 121167]KAF2146312.1 hypothetical protein K452DRAFT_305259 [Aplosporella prunicola CBS 121167]
MNDAMDVPPLLGATNYSEWHECLKLHMLGQGLWDIVTKGNAQPDGEDGIDEVAKEKDQCALDILNQTIDQSLVLLKPDHLTTAKELYDYLKVEYEHRESTTQSLSYANLIQLRYGGEGLQKFTRKYLAALSNCRKAGLILDEKIQVYHLLALLDRDFADFTTARREEMYRDNVKLEWLINEIIVQTKKEETNYSRPYRGLPQELRDMIFKFALCPPEGVTIKEEEKKEGEDSSLEKFRSTQSFPVTLLRTDSQTYDVAKKIFYGKNSFTMDMESKPAMSFFMMLPKGVRNQIRTLRFQNSVFGQQFYYNAVPDNLLGHFITEHMKAESVTAFIEHDCYHEEINTDTRKCLPFACLNAIAKGEHLKEVRLVYSRTYSEDISVYSGFLRIEVSGEQLLPPLIRYRHEGLWYRHSRMSMEEKMAAVAANEKTYRKAWNDFGLSVERDPKRCWGEEGTVLVIRRLKTARNGQHSSSSSPRVR